MNKIERLKKVRERSKVDMLNVRGPDELGEVFIFGRASGLRNILVATTGDSWPSNVDDAYLMVEAVNALPSLLEVVETAQNSTAARLASPMLDAALRKLER